MSVSVADPARRETLSAIRLVVIAAERYREAVAAHFGLDRTEAQAVSQLATSGGRGQTGLAVRVGITTGASTALIDRLETAGIARRTAHPTDRRRTIVTITEHGQALVAEGRESLNRLFEGLEGHARPPVTAVLETIAEPPAREIPGR